MVTFRLPSKFPPPPPPPAGGWEKSGSYCSIKLNSVTLSFRTMDRRGLTLAVPRTSQRCQRSDIFKTIIHSAIALGQSAPETRPRCPKYSITDLDPGQACIFFFHQAG